MYNAYYVHLIHSTDKYYCVIKSSLREQTTSSTSSSTLHAYTHGAIHTRRTRSIPYTTYVSHASYRPSVRLQKSPRPAFAPRRGRDCKRGLERDELECEREALEGERRGEREGERVGEGEREADGEGEGDRAIEVEPSRLSACHVPAPATCHPSPSEELQQHAREAEECVMSRSVGLASPPTSSMMSGMLSIEKEYWGGWVSQGLSCSRRCSTATCASRSMRLPCRSSARELRGAGGGRLDRESRGRSSCAPPPATVRHDATRTRARGAAWGEAHGAA